VDGVEWVEAGVFLKIREQPNMCSDVGMPKTEEAPTKQGSKGMCCCACVAVVPERDGWKKSHRRMRSYSRLEIIPEEDYVFCDGSYNESVLI